MIRIVARAFLAAAFALVAVACGGGPNRTTKDIASIVVTGDVCASCSKSLVVHADGRLEDISAGNEASIHDPRGANAMLASFPIDEFAALVKRLPTITTPANMAIVIVLFHDGSFERAAVPVGNPLYDGIGNLQQWTTRVDTAASGELFANRWKAIDGALARRTMRYVVLESATTFGRCPVYTATFHRSNLVTLRERGIGCDRTSTLHGRFARVLEAISDSGGSRMHAYYPVLARHTSQARITLVTPDGTFVSTGPDRTSWGPEFLATESRLDQIVRDLRTPPSSVAKRRSRGRPSRRGKPAHRSHARKHAARNR